jgi:hypothetical protein
MLSKPERSRAFSGVIRYVARLLLSALFPLGVGMYLFGVPGRPLPIFDVWSPVTEIVIFGAALGWSFRLIAKPFPKRALLIACVYFPIMLVAVAYLSLRLWLKLGGDNL